MRSQESHSLRFTSREKRILLIVLIAIAFYFVLDKLPAVRAACSAVIRILRPLLIGCAFAFLMNPPAETLEKVKVLLVSSLYIPETLRYRDYYSVEPHD